MGLEKSFRGKCRSSAVFFFWHLVCISRAWYPLSFSRLVNLSSFSRAWYPLFTHNLSTALGILFLFPVICTRRLQFPRLATVTFFPRLAPVTFFLRSACHPLSISRGWHLFAFSRVWQPLSFSSASQSVVCLCSGQVVTSRCYGSKIFRWQQTENVTKK